MVNRSAIKTIALCLLIISCEPIALSLDRNPMADLVIKNAKVITIDRDNPRAQAIAFRGERILAATSNESADKYIKRGVSKVIDARGRLVVPGFNDAHIHFGPIDPDYIDLRYVTDPNIITTEVREAVARAKPGE
ncbi:MAG: amidohydrolase family protein, partial [Planctomycetota bacterium]